MTALTLARLLSRSAKVVLIDLAPSSLAPARDFDRSRRAGPCRIAAETGLVRRHHQSRPLFAAAWSPPAMAALTGRCCAHQSSTWCSMRCCASMTTCCSMPAPRPTCPRNS
ncbi:MAG: hypothetical protein MZV49_02940 [Rhodopseudomonas palustris]|nr:hypothetical protein [Rhodopseudomonas palustris]